MVMQTLEQMKAAAFYLLVLWCNWVGELGVDANAYYNYSRHDFPSHFIFGASTSAYQVEGAAFEDGRTASIFDTFAHSDRYVAGDGDIASDQYHKYKEDVQLMVETGLDAYRFSISWSRLIPDGRGDVNPKGLEYYNNLINELIDHGIQPHVTLVHFDVPQILEDEYGGILSTRIIDDFTAYADVCFREFGDRVLHWTTFNEANLLAMNGQIFVNSTSFSPLLGFSSSLWNLSTDPYIGAHNLLLAHASVARLYREKYQAKQGGLIAISIYAPHFIPSTNTKEDALAAQRSRDFFIGWLMSPIMHGDYPKIMKKNVGSRLPSFTKNEGQLVKGSIDFLGLNYYFVIMAKDNPTNSTMPPTNFFADMAAQVIFMDGMGSQGSYPITPWGLQGTLEHFKQVYNNPPIFIYENGQMTDYNTSVNDSLRVDYLQSHIGGLLDTVRNGSNTKGYFVWSFVDVFEILYGYGHSMGLYYVDFNDQNLTRYPKMSQKWYSKFLKDNSTIFGEQNQEQHISTNYRHQVDVLNLQGYPGLLAMST